ncbi:rab3 GTPase-activating protein catalytic subunit-like isoform X2 [Homarus americanus]|uniref:rab3 GTPase-activating protein catalytic subunit-like isoform X2 n=1 Tax=Homarus americanus TaxID=6706 RepID=UPI001C4612DC|nr:rab3 GTPase-activating protein catalytic subunit-like isoform X2 [Homarus americanus]
MGTQIADDQEVFEIVDFTTASEWECFIAAVVEAVHEWRLSGERQLSPLNKGQLATAKWSERTVTVKFVDFPFKMTHFSIVSESIESPPDESEPSTEYENEEETERLPQALDDLMNRENDFPARAHCLVRWYGLREFVTICPSNPNNSILCPSKSKLLLSSLTIAANNTNCQVPMFVQVLLASEKMYLGVGLGSGVRTDYDMVHMKRPPRQCTHLAGLLDVFRSKLQCTVTSPPVLVSVRFTYVLTEWPHTLWTQQPPDFDATLTEVGFSDLGKLPFGALSDPVSELHLSATWPCVSEDVLVDSDVYSDLDPGSAPLWTARLVTAASPPCLLSEYLTEFLNLCQNSQSVTQILGPEFTPEVDDPAQFSSAFDRLTEPSVPTLSKMVGRVRPGSKGSKQSSSIQSGEMGPIPTDILVPILNYLFPDAEGEESSAPFPSSLSQIPEWNVEGEQAGEHPLKALLSNMKSSGADGLVWRLAVVLCHVTHSLGGLSAAAHLWHEVVLEFRYRWDNAISILGIGSGSPDLASTLLHQKLQMLNCCIVRRRTREQSSSNFATDDIEDDDEFYECEEEMEEEERSNGSRSSWDKPEGRLKRCGKLRLIKTNEQLFVPYTQEPAPMTEDRLEEHSDVLLRLGTDSVGSQLRARMMSASLLSDMESFKAANPGAVLEDFVRWYSPRDWIEEASDDSSQPPCGSLSARMQIPGNMWMEVWNNAKPVPARRQKRLFDDTREAEQVLHWLASMGPGAVCSHLQPTILHASLCRLAEERILFSLPAPSSLPQPCHSNTLATILDMIAQRIVRLSRQPPDTNKYQEVVDQIAEVEVCIARAQSVRHKLMGDITASHTSSSLPLEELVLRLLDSPEVVLDGGPRGPAAAVIRKLFQQANRASMLVDDSPQESPGSYGDRRSSLNFGASGTASELGRPAGREYLLRTLVPAPTAYSRPVPHRMFAVLLQNEFRLAGAYSQDTTFC